MHVGKSLIVKLQLMKLKKKCYDLNSQVLIKFRDMLSKLYQCVHL